jgi:hypothetical protein
MKTILAVLSFAAVLTSGGVVGQVLSFEETKALAEQGGADDQFELGVAYIVQDNFPEAWKWMSLAANNGSAPAQTFMGSMYDNGEEVPENNAEAVKWYKLAAVQGNSLAQFSLGAMYANGEGIRSNLILSYVWFTMAFNRGATDVAGEARDLITKALTPEQLARAQEIATRCFESDYQDCE